MKDLNFEEELFNFNSIDALNEASRCLSCKNPTCVKGCPVGNNIPLFISKIKEGKFASAKQILLDNNIMESICCRVCAQEKQCEGNCILAKKGCNIKIGTLEKYVMSIHDDYIPKIKEKSGKTVALIGTGPASLACAYDLLKEGFSVTAYEAANKAGGELRYGIPKFRLDEKHLDNVINRLKDMGLKIIYNTRVGKVVDFSYIKDSYDYVFVGVGAKVCKSMNIENENANGVIAASDFLLKIYNELDMNMLMSDKKYKNVIVVGAGNVAMDASRTARRLHPDNVTIVYRRSEAEMPCRKEEIDSARSEGIDILTLTNPIKVIVDENNSVKAVECLKMRLGEPDESGRRRPIEIDGSNFTIPCDLLIMALGNNASIDQLKGANFEYDKWQCITVNENGETNQENVYAGGDCCTGSNTVAAAIKAGKLAASKIIEKQTQN